MYVTVVGLEEADWLIARQEKVGRKTRLIECWEEGGGDMERRKMNMLC